MTDVASGPLLAGAQLDARLAWHCEPGRWSLREGGRVLRVETEAPTDFWRKTHYGFEADSGHFLGAATVGDFVLTAHITYQPVHQYDQAGLMVRLSPQCWLKTSVEYEPAAPARLGVVVTSGGYSDWSTQNVAAGGGAIWQRVRREGDDYLVEASWDGARWEQLRLTHLADERSTGVTAGVYACSPKGAGLVAEFRELSITPGRVRE